MRKASLHRNTNETDIRVKLNLDGRGKAHIDTGIRFFDHMLEQIARHGALDLDLVARGDLDVDQHHTVEDVGIALGEAVKQALGSKRGILRAGYFLMPMDESLAHGCARFFRTRAFCLQVAAAGSTRRRFSDRAARGFFPGVRASSSRERAFALVYGRSSHHQVEVDVQGLRARAAFRRDARSAAAPGPANARRDCCENFDH